MIEKTRRPYWLRKKSIKRARLRRRRTGLRSDLLGELGEGIESLVYVVEAL